MLRTYTPPATPPATRDLQTLRKAWLGALTPSLASLASSARFTIVVTADSLVVFATASSDDISKPQKIAAVCRFSVAIDGRLWRIYRRVRARMSTLWGRRGAVSLYKKKNFLERNFDLSEASFFSFFFFSFF